MTAPRILIAGIGNIFLGDDAFGVEVARRLAERKLPDCARVVDFGIRGFDLAYAILDDYDLTILVDATPRGSPPGTLYKIEPDLSGLGDPDSPGAALETHGMNPLNVFRLVRSMGGEPRRVLLVGCEPAELNEEEDGRMGLSPAVATAVDEAAGMIEGIIREAAGEMGSEK